jgi:uncharacterized protein
MLTPLRFWWHELNTWHPEDALAFYGRTLGWVFEPMQLSDGTPYWTARKWGLPVGGIMGLDEDRHGDIPSHWMTYMAVDGMDGAIEETLKAGGSVARAAIPVPGIGLLAVVSDPAGALIGLMEPDKTHAATPLRSAVRSELRPAIPPLSPPSSPPAGPEASAATKSVDSSADSSAGSSCTPSEEAGMEDEAYPMPAARAQAG